MSSRSDEKRRGETREEGRGKRKRTEERGQDGPKPDWGRGITGLERLGNQASVRSSST